MNPHLETQDQCLNIQISHQVWVSLGEIWFKFIIIFIIKGQTSLSKGDNWTVGFLKPIFEKKNSEPSLKDDNCFA